MEKRKLYPHEIEYILDFITANIAIPKITAESIMEKNKNSIRVQLERIEIYPDYIDSLKEEMSRQYHKSLIQPGENVGIISAQNIGKEQTQTTLDAFHKAGASENLLVGGISRFNEIMMMTEEPKVTSSKIYYNLKCLGNPKLAELRDSIGSKILEINFKKIIDGDDFTIYKNKEELEKDVDRKKWLSVFREIYPLEDYDNYYMVYKLKKEYFFEYKLSMRSIVKKISRVLPNVDIYHSPIIADNIEIIFCPSEEEYINKRDILELNKQIELIHLFGIRGIKQLFFLKEGDEWISETEGTNFKKILSHELVDETRTLSSQVWDIYRTLGIEASREYLINELGNIMADNNECDIQILSDVMTYSGTLTSISRFALKREQTGPMSKSTFEEPLVNFQLAGFYCEKDKTNSVSSNIIYGKLARIGTGCVDLIYDTSAVLEKNI